MALLSHPHFKDVLRDYQELEYVLLKQIYSYKYDFKDFMYKVFNQIEFFRHLDAQAFHLVLYSMVEIY